MYAFINTALCINHIQRKINHRNISSLNMQPNKYLELKSFKDVFYHRNELINYVKNNKDNDIVYYFKHEKTKEKIIKHDWCISGSKAILETQKQLILYKDIMINTDNINTDNINKGNINKGNINKDNIYNINNDNINNENIENNLHINKFVHDDVDIFHMNSEFMCYYRLDSFEIIYTKDKNPEQILMNADLPCCRAAFDGNYNFWVSIQCLHSLLTREIYLPKYTSSIQDLHNVFMNNIKKGANTNNEDELASAIRFHDRLNKYIKRGYKCIYYDTDVILPWIINRYYNNEWI